MDTLETSLNPDINQSKDVTGSAYIEHNGFTPETDIDYKARSEEKIFPHIQKISNELLKDEESCLATMLVATLDDEVKNGDKKTLTGKGYEVSVLCVPQSDGGGTDAYAIPFNLYEQGARTQGDITVTSGKPTFEADSDTL